MLQRGDYRQGSGRRDMRNEAQDADEPEWFTEGPSSQLETIELVGFEADERRKRQQAEAKVAEAEKKATEVAEKKDDEASKKDDAGMTALDYYNVCQILALMVSFTSNQMSVL